MSDTGRTCGVSTEALHLVLLVVFEVAFEPVPLAFRDVAFPREDVGTGAVQEPTVVGNDHCTAREVLECIFQGAQSFHVEVVCRLIEEDQVSALLQGQREVEAVALTTGEDLGWLLLICALESEADRYARDGISFCPTMM